MGIKDWAKKQLNKLRGKTTKPHEDATLQNEDGRQWHAEPTVTETNLTQQILQAGQEWLDKPLNVRLQNSHHQRIPTKEEMAAVLAENQQEPIYNTINAVQPQEDPIYHTLPTGGDLENNYQTFSHLVAPEAGDNYQNVGGIQKDPDLLDELIGEFKNELGEEAVKQVYQGINNDALLREGQAWLDKSKEERLEDSHHQRIPTREEMQAEVLRMGIPTREGMKATPPEATTGFQQALQEAKQGLKHVKGGQDVEQGGSVSSDASKAKGQGNGVGGRR